MADNKTVTNTKTSFDADTNADYTVATDEISSVEYQEIKLVDGTKGETTPVAVAGGLEANALRVTIASDSTGVLSVDDNGGSLTIDGTVTANLGTIADVATQTTLATIDTDTGEIAAGYATEGSALGSGVLLQGDDGTDRKNINVDATTGDVQVDVTNTVTISGTVTANAGTNLNTSALATEATLATIDTDTGNIATNTSTTATNTTTIAGAVSGNEMQVDIVAYPTVSSVTEATGGVTTSNAEILASSASRKGGYIENVSDTTVWLSLGGTATTAAPTSKLTPNGTFGLTIGGVVYTGAVNAIHGGSGTKNVTIVTF